MKSILILGRRWRDRINGNTYHACRVFVDGKREVTCPFQYGYGEQYVWTGWHALVHKLGLEVLRWPKEGNIESCWQYCDRNGIDYIYEVADMACKRDVVSYGQGE